MAKEFYWVEYFCRWAGYRVCRVGDWLTDISLELEHQRRKPKGLRPAE